MASAAQDSALRKFVATGAASTPNVLVNGVQRDRNSLLRSQASEYADTTASTRPSNISAAADRGNGSSEPPRFVIDLSLPPEQRYLEVCAGFHQRIKGVTPLFDEVVSDLLLSLPRPLCWVPIQRIHQMARLCLRGVYDQEETRELVGISKKTGVEMHLLVSFNVLLDLLMGCSSGGAVIRDGKGGTKMVHFRTLDWGMPSLRKLVVQLDFKARQDGPIIASSVTYAGYIGVLTGVRKDFSVSLNFRSNRKDNGTRWPDLKYPYHLLMVLLGKRRSISSQLRCFLLPEKQPVDKEQHEVDTWRRWSYEDVISLVGGRAARLLTSTACYLCFSNGEETTVIEKDRTTAAIRSSSDYIGITNNDLAHEDEASIPEQSGDWQVSLADIVSEGKERRQCTENDYYTFRRHKAKSRRRDGFGFNLREALGIDNIVTMLQFYPTTNEATHFACVMDPKEGVFHWCRRWAKPITKKWIADHQGFPRSE